MDTHRATADHERRTGIDRRNWACHYEFPYIDGHGFLVTGDRRQNSERRELSRQTAHLSGNNRTP